MLTIIEKHESNNVFTYQTHPHVEPCHLFRFILKKMGEKNSTPSKQFQNPFGKLVETGGIGIS
jgi:hypothetical protein